MWVLDFNRVSQAWGGTVAYSEEQPTRDVVNVQWDDFPGLIVSSVSASEMKGARSAADALADDGEEYEDDEYADDDEQAEDGDLVTVSMPARLNHNVLPDATLDGGTSHQGLPSLILFIAGGSMAVLALGFGLVKLSHLRRRRSAKPAAKVVEVDAGSELAPPQLAPVEHKV